MRFYLFFLVWIFQCSKIFCEWCDMTKTLYLKVKRCSTASLFQKCHVAFTVVLAVTNACPSIFSRLFTVNKVTFIVKQSHLLLDRAAFFQRKEIPFIWTHAIRKPYRAVYYTSKGISYKAGNLL